ncbi:MAG: heme biosynthesis HemY N-terminal domain-containing protein [Gallionellaceae bacterium]
MKFLFWLLGLFVLAVALTLAAHNPGYVMLVYPPYRAGMSLSFFVIALLVLFVAIYLALRLAFAALRLPEYVREFRSERVRAKGRNAMLEALSAFFEERYALAEKAAERAMDLDESYGLNAIIAARSAHKLHDYARRDVYISALEGRPESERTMRLITIARFCLDQYQPLMALKALRELRESGVSNHAGALRLELRALQQAHNWDAALDVVNMLEKRNAIDAITAGQMRQQAWLKKVQADAQNGPALKEAWKSVPAEFRLQSKIAAAAAQAFIHLGEHAVARDIITDSLKMQWDSDLTLLYGDCISDDVVGQIEQAERWLQSHTRDAGLLLALGKLCLHQQLWGKAQNYLDASISISPCRRAYMELGRLAEMLQKPHDAFRYFRKSMELEGE